MTRVVIQPAYANAEAKRNWAETLDVEVNFRTVERLVVLSESDLAALDALHPQGNARFWGVPAHHDGKADKIEVGDIVLFTGKKLVRAIGEIGCVLRNTAFADTLWSPSADHGSYRNVYSLLSFESTSIPYEEIWELPGFNVGDNFMSMRLLDEAKSHTVIGGLRIETADIQRENNMPQPESGEGAGSQVKLISPEAMNTTSTTYERKAGTLTVNRAESALVQTYKSILQGVEIQRLRIAGAGITDLHVTGPKGVEIVEAKRDSTHPFVREALGQLLDYVAGYGQPTDRLTALFPACPAAGDVKLLGHYGIDCVYPDPSSVFARISAPPTRRHEVWQNSVTPS
jgi:hypothetical protein